MQEIGVGNLKNKNKNKTNLKYKLHNYIEFTNN